MNYIEISGPMCRACRHLLKSTSGCDFCLSVKPLIVWPVLHETDHIDSAQKVVTHGLRAARKLVRIVEKRVSEELDPTDLSRLTRDLTSALRTMKELAGEQRKLEDRDAEHLANSTFEDRIRLFAEELFAKLPEHHQREFLRLCNELTQLQAAPQVAALPEPE